MRLCMRQRLAALAGGGEEGRVFVRRPERIFSHSACTIQQIHLSRSSIYIYLTGQLNTFVNSSYTRKKEEDAILLTCFPVVLRQGNII